MNRLIGKRNESILIVNGVETTGLIDTGSEISTVSEEFWTSLDPKPEILVVEKSNVQMAVLSLIEE